MFHRFHVLFLVFIYLGNFGGLVHRRQIPLVCADNPTSIVPPLPGADPGYIIAESDSGLGNRLRVMAAYMYIAEYKFEGAHLVFIWDKNEA